mmetsp:Transcript_47795/g.133008  ORF Transcript_47795/g.133008 Transcript_47795/m.133008 type:complete len:205 (-) Transcript_47795:20-634(-)
MSADGRELGRRPCAHKVARAAGGLCCTNSPSHELASELCAQIWPSALGLAPMMRDRGGADAAPQDVFDAVPAAGLVMKARFDQRSIEYIYVCTSNIPIEARDRIPIEITDLQIFLLNWKANSTRTPALSPVQTPQAPHFFDIRRKLKQHRTNLRRRRPRVGPLPGKAHYTTGRPLLGPPPPGTCGAYPIPTARKWPVRLLAKPG